MSQRRVRFNVNELARLAAEAVGEELCVSIEMYPDGMYNKAMLLTMDNGTQIVAKVPNPNAGIPHFTTASEVATMDFARNVLGTPIPRVFAWSSRAQENPVGAEYIIMEKVPGIELERVWPSMGIEDRFTLVKAMAGFQKAWTATIDFDRGPWGNLQEYHTAIGLREIACVNRLPRLPKSPITLCDPGTYQPTRERKLDALDCYLKLTKFLLPIDQSIASSHLWHGDLHAANIFVNPNKPTEIVGLIDLQSTELSPLYFQARQPHIIDYDGPPVHGLERPQLPKDIEQLDATAKEHAKALYLQKSLCSLYNTLTYHQNPQVYAAFEFQQTTSYLLLLLARNLLIDGEASYLSQLAELKATWDTLPEAKTSFYPFSFSTKEQQVMQANVEGVMRGMEAMHSIKESIGELFPEHGVVRADQYEEVLDALEQIKGQVIEEFARSKQEREVWLKEWPFGT
ncbi:hypothetical protein DSL72_003544 [Monilinia vaccinii-corymbosi]|uniref:Aminoglycoside phosphotransferase domain-containing protein n=1 Tax=Monilinia vaccinii-corymbosi TaxID=61207 RepID=A0A8A3NZY6_9HELO|nr:hypothetical protein DSL72_003544 [Monilinia vaccinii-corymbosi]